MKQKILLALVVLLILVMSGLARADVLHDVNTAVVTVDRGIRNFLKNMHSLELVRHELNSGTVLYVLPVRRDTTKGIYKSVLKGKVNVGINIIVIKF